MFFQLILKECRQTAKSMIYWLIVIVMGIFFFSQMGTEQIVSKPQPGQEDYGTAASTDKNVIMEYTLGSLLMEYEQGSYVTYPVGFYKSVTLNKEQQKQIGDILQETAGMTSMEEAEEASGQQNAEKANTDDSGAMFQQNLKVEPKEGLSYERFQTLMKEADDLLGGGSSYSESGMMNNGQVKLTYEQAVEQYDTLMEKDHLSGGYARLFCDYMGIVLGILPVFLAVTREMRDRRSKMQALIASRRCSSVVIIAGRYLAMLIMLMLPVLILSCYPLAECIQQGAKAGVDVDVLAFVKYSFGWLMPTVMAATAVGMLLTELTDTALGVLVQLIWWFLTIFTSINSMDGGQYGWSLVPRHNTIYNYEGFQAGFAQLAANRCLYVGISVLMVLAAMWIYSMKRKGRLDFRGKISRNFKRKHKV